MNTQRHWETVYGAKPPDQVSWFRPHLETSLSFIERSAPDRSARIIDVEGGESTLVDDLLARGYCNLTILDISQTAINVTRRGWEPWLIASNGSQPILRGQIFRQMPMTFGTTARFFIS